MKKNSALTPAPISAPTADAVETYTLTREEQLLFTLVEERVKAANVALQLATLHVETSARSSRELHKELEAKYSENGKYEFVGSLDLGTGVGRRKLKE